MPEAGTARQLPRAPAAAHLTRAAGGEGSGLRPSHWRALPSLRGRGGAERRPRLQPPREPPTRPQGRNPVPGGWAAAPPQRERVRGLEPLPRGAPRVERGLAGLPFAWPRFRGRGRLLPFAAPSRGEERTWTRVLRRGQRVLNSLGSWLCPAPRVVPQISATTFSAIS